MFISIDGIDGAGKTSLAVALANWFNTTYNTEVVITKEPTSESPWAKELRQAALTERLPRNVEIEYFHKDRLWHLENVIIPTLNDGKHVISDRYVDSTLAYQATSIRDANKLISRMRKEILIPDLTFILDCNVEVCLQRITDRDLTITSFETHETLKFARKVFMSRNGKHYRFIDSSINVEHTFSKAVKEIIAWRESRSCSDTSEPRKPTISPENSTFVFV